MKIQLAVILKLFIQNSEVYDNAKIYSGCNDRFQENC